MYGLNTSADDMRFPRKALADGLLHSLQDGGQSRDLVVGHTKVSAVLPGQQTQNAAYFISGMW